MSNSQKISNNRDVYLLCFLIYSILFYSLSQTDSQDFFSQAYYHNKMLLIIKAVFDGGFDVR